MDEIFAFVKQLQIHGAPEGALLSIFLLGLARIVPIVAIAPFFGAKVMPAPIRMGLAIILVLMLMPKLVFTVKTDMSFMQDLPGLAVLALKELFIGFSLGFLVIIPFLIADMSGSMIDSQRGAQSLQVNNPSLANQSSPIGMLYYYMLIFLFLEFNGPFYFLDAVQKSYDILPPDKLLNPAFFDATSPWWSTIFEVIDTTATLALKLAAPALLTIFMADTFLGIANRLATQLQISFLGMPLKSLLAIAILIPAWFIIIKQMIVESANWLRVIEMSLEGLAA